MHAWKDEEEQDRSGTRRSHHDQVETFDIPFGKIDGDQLKKALEKAYSTVSSWSQADLTQTSPLPPLPIG